MMKKIWFMNYLITIVVFALLSLYLWVWRGNYNAYIFNKAIASTAAIIAGLTLVLSYFAKYKLFTSYMDLRRTLGLTALGLVVGHLFFSMVILQSSFSVQWMIKEKYSMIVGFAAVFIWFYLAWLSRPHGSVGKDTRWRLIQRWGGRFAFILIYLHILFLKYPSWISWWKGQAGHGPAPRYPQLPPSNLLVFICMSTIILIFVYSMANEALSKKK